MRKSEVAADETGWTYFEVAVTRREFVGFLGGDDFTVAVLVHDTTFHQKSLNLESRQYSQVWTPLF